MGGGSWGERSSRLQGKAASPVFRLKEELVGMIVGLSGAWPAGRAGREEGVVRLLGGVAAPKRNEGLEHSKLGRRSSALA